MTPSIEVGDIPTPTSTQPHNFNRIEVGLITPSNLNKKKPCESSQRSYSSRPQSYLRIWGWGWGGMSLTSIVDVIHIWANGLLRLGWSDSNHEICLSTLLVCAFIVIVLVAIKARSLGNLKPSNKKLDLWETPTLGNLLFYCNPSCPP